MNSLSPEQYIPIGTCVFCGITLWQLGDERPVWEEHSGDCLHIKEDDNDLVSYRIIYSRFCRVSVPG